VLLRGEKRELLLARQYQAKADEAALLFWNALGEEIKGERVEKSESEIKRRTENIDIKYFGLPCRHASNDMPFNIPLEASAEISGRL
jgi:hypothetical protein